MSEERTYTQSEVDNKIMAEVQAEKKKHEDAAYQMKDCIREYRTRITQQDKVIESLSTALANLSCRGGGVEF